MINRLIFTRTIYSLNHVVDIILEDNSFIMNSNFGKKIIPISDIRQFNTIVTNLENKNIQGCIDCLRRLENSDIKEVVEILNRELSRPLFILEKYKRDMTEKDITEEKEHDKNRREMEAIKEKQKNAQTKKKAILKNQPLMMLDNTKMPNCVEAILSQTYSDIANISKVTEFQEAFTKRIIECIDYQKAPLLSAFMHVIALSCIRGSNAVKKQPLYLIKQLSKYFRSSEVAIEEKEKKLKIILTTDDDFIKDLNKGRRASGFYALQHSILANIAGRDGVSVVFHEASHYAVFEIMQNECDPYKKDDLVSKSCYLKIIQDVQQRYKYWEPVSEQKQITIDIISDAFDSDYYLEHEYGRELFVKIAEVIGVLGYQDGLKLLNKYVPQLVNYYENVFNNVCMKYLIKYRAAEYMKLDPSLAHELDKYQQEMDKRFIDAPLTKNIRMDNKTPENVANELDKTMRKEGMEPTWIKTLEIAKDFYAEGKALYFTKNSQKAIVFFQRAKEKCKEALNASDIDTRNKKIAQKRVEKIENPSGKYFPFNLANK